jgi:hypothetical protein
MADTKIADINSTPDPEDDFSLWARHFKITSSKTDPARWNEEWEKALLSLSSGFVYATMGGRLKESQMEPDKLSQLIQGTKDDLSKAQKTVAKLWDDLRGEGHFKMAWLLLDERERRRHLLKGLEQACEHAAWGQDSRALCPEITISSMLKLKGRAFIDFIRDYTDGMRGVGVGSWYCLPSEWWDKAVEDVPGPVLEVLPESTFMVLTLHRNEFISESVGSMQIYVIGDTFSSRFSPGVYTITYERFGSQESWN